MMTEEQQTKVTDPAKPIEFQIKKMILEKMRTDEGRILPHAAGSLERQSSGRKAGHTNACAISFVQDSGCDYEVLRIKAGNAAKDLCPTPDQMPRPWKRSQRMVVTVTIEESSPDE
jgi:hypothetical protein